MLSLIRGLLCFSTSRYQARGTQSPWRSCLTAAFALKQVPLCSRSARHYANRNIVDVKSFYKYGGCPYVSLRFPEGDTGKYRHNARLCEAQGGAVNSQELAYKLSELERKIERHDDEIKAVFDAIRGLIMNGSRKRRNRFLTLLRGI